MEITKPQIKRFNHTKNLQKAVASLSGILQGITADTKLNEQELLFLDVWLRSQSHLKDDGDVIDLLDLITDILADGIITSDELKELQELVNDIIEFRDISDIDVPYQINELIGLLCGIAADDKLEDLEIQSIIDWIELNENTVTEWPINIIIERLGKIVVSGKVSDKNRSEFLSMIKKITGTHFSDTGSAKASTTDFFENNINDIKHIGANFCFTGVFFTGTRSQVQNIAKENEAKVTKDVSKNTDYLVIGTTESADWRFASYGRKIEKALQLQVQGFPIKIITEKTWISHIK